MVKRVGARLVCLVVAIVAASCTVHKTEEPPLSGPSEFATSAAVTATPDSLTQDGASQSAILVTARDANGRPLANQPFRLDMSVNGVVQDFGQLSARTIVTGTDGKATTIYTAPPPPPASLGGSGTRVTILATLTGSNAITSPAGGPSSAEIRLVPPGVILPSADTPTAAFTFTPTPVNMSIPVTFDASTSCGGPIVNNVCASLSAIVSYAWTFGDGGTGTGKTVSHTFTSANTFNVTLTVTNDRGVAASTTQPVTVSALAIPTASFVFSPTSPVIGDTVLFNADASRAAPGHTLVQFNWNFGDNSSTGTASGFVVTHAFARAGTYNVVLTVADDVGGRATTTQAVTVATGNPVPLFTVSPTQPTHGIAATFDASGTTLFSGATVKSYNWEWGDGKQATSTPTNPTTHTFDNAGTYTVTLTVTDSLDRQGVFSRTVTVQ